MTCIHLSHLHCRIRTIILILLLMIPVVAVVVVSISKHLYSKHSIFPSELLPLLEMQDWTTDTNVITHNWTTDTNDVSNCSKIPPHLVGPISTPKRVRSFTYLHKLYPKLEPGGHYHPRLCKALHRVAIIVPYRDRENHLKLFLEHMHWLLQKQQLDYTIFIVELVSGVPFNRALLMNIGYAEAIKQYDFQCFVFHDVDLLPENDRNIYSCPRKPRHMTVAVNTLQYRLPYKEIFGGAIAMSRKHFELVNGFSNMFFGWGGEDDDMYNRVRENGLNIVRYSASIARYKMLRHSKDVANPERHKLLNSGMQRWRYDGINSLKYKRLSIEFLPLYTKILVAYSTPESPIQTHTVKDKTVSKADLHQHQHNQQVLKDNLFSVTDKPQDNHETDNMLTSLVDGAS